MIAAVGTHPARPQHLKTLLLAALLSLSLFVGVAGSTTAEAASPRFWCETRLGYVVVCYWK